MSQNQIISPFQEAKKLNKRWKFMIYGDTGTGKTILSLFLSKLLSKDKEKSQTVMFDLDSGADLYGDRFNFHVLKSTNLTTVDNSIRWLLSNPHEFQTLIMDPVTIYWEILQKHWNKIFITRLSGRSANKHEFYECGPKEWSTIKSHFKALMNALISCNMNIIVTARQTDKLVCQGGKFVTDGIKPDCEKSLVYTFDAVLHLFRDGDKYMIQTEKDRNGKFPPLPFQFSEEELSNYLDLNISPKRGKEERTE